MVMGFVFNGKSAFFYITHYCDNDTTKKQRCNDTDTKEG